MSHSTLWPPPHTRAPGLWTLCGGLLAVTVALSLSTGCTEGLLAACGGCPEGSVCDAATGDCVSANDVLGGDVRLDTQSCACGPSEACCEGDCVNLASNSDHCGRCGAACLDGESCDAGLCACPAPAGVPVSACNAIGGETCCPGSGCVHLAESPFMCGACDAPCNPGEECQGGLCACGGGPACAPNTACCNGTCCGSGELCCQGMCAPADDPVCVCGSDGVCGATEMCCQTDGVEACHDTARDPSHCGGCDRGCAQGLQCHLGECVCGSGQGDCDADPANGCETDLSADAAHCGACGRACDQGESCVAGTCLCGSSVCAVGQACCDAACIDIQHDIAHCGGCQLACPVAGGNALGMSCMGGVCVAACPAGWGNCDGEPGDGCEADLGTLQTCGNCETTCRPLEQCSNGVCVCLSGQCDCLANEIVCDSVCIDAQTDAAHCGGCGVACQGGMVCAAGSCVCPAGTTNCGGSCVASNTYCAAGTSDSQSEGCGNCGTRTRTRTCAATCGWAAWGAWSACSGQGTCAQGATESKSVSCTRCGSQQQQRTCSASCTWGGWSNVGGCSGQGTCDPGATSDCNTCTHKVCNNSCNWGSCVLKSGNTCDWNGGSTYHCCGAGKSEFCLSSCRWSGACTADCTSCGC